MARFALKPATWPLSLRWVVAMVVVPVLPFASFAALGITFLFLRLGLFALITLAAAYAMLLFIPAAWVSFLPTYFLIDKWGQHSKQAYVKGAMLAAVVGALLFAAYFSLTGASASESLPWVGFGLLVGLPTAALMGSMIWCILWSGREVAEEGKS